MRLNARVSTIGWLKSLILIATYQSLFCFDSNRSDSTSYIMDAWWPCWLRNQSFNPLIAGSNSTPFSTRIKFLFI